MKRFKKASDIRVGVVGYGAAYLMGPHHLREMQKAGMTAVAVTDLDPECRKAAEADFPGIKTYSTVAEMLKRSDLDLAVLITPHNTHAPLALQCLRAGKHVVCEKPLAVTTAECNAMIAEAKKRGLVISTYHNRHWDGCILRAVKAIRSGAIGDVVRIEAHVGQRRPPKDMWRDCKSISGGILYDWGVHLLEYSLQIIDSKITEVSGFAKTGFWAPSSPWKKDANEDEGFAVVRFANGAWMTLCATQIDSNPKRGMMEITGTKGTYLFEIRTWEVSCIGDNGETVITKGASPANEGWRFYQNIADHLTKGEKLVITPEWARRPIHILDLAGQSARKGTALKPKYD